MKIRAYDSTVARIAGNLASGLMNSSIDIPQHQAFVARVAVHIARLIVAETMRTEPVPDDAVGQRDVEPHLTTREKSS